ncbi:MAG: glycine--tRNA ligase, partial [Verrucomicrobiota bacterium]
DEINAHIAKLKEDGTQLTCPNCGSTDLTPARRFSLMVKSNIGAPTEAISDDNAVFLRAETCQGIYLNYLNVMNSTRAKVPFGIAQIGKAFRNEIIARQFVFRTREFEQMEMQYFAHKDDTEKLYEDWREQRFNWYQTLGIPEERLRWHKHGKLAHYASAAYDVEYQFSCLGDEFCEVEGLHMRGDWDLSQHQKFSDVSMEYNDQQRNEKYIPHVVETSAGLNRIFMMVLDNAYREEQLEDGKTRAVLKLHPRLAPVKVAVFPLVRNKPHLVEYAEKIFKDLADHFVTEWDDNSNVGKRYRRQDEIGTPCCVTVDFESLDDHTVTVRNRDTMEQVRVPVDELKACIGEQVQ